MMEIENTGSFGIVKYFHAKQGNRIKATIEDYSGRRDGVTYEKPIYQGDLVKLVDDMTVEKCDAGDTPIGIAYADYEHEGALPKEAATYGEYDNNVWVRVELFAPVMKAVKLEPANSKIVANDPIKIGATTVGCYDKGTATNNNIALESALANSGAIINVLFNYRPI